MTRPTAALLALAAALPLTTAAQTATHRASTAKRPATTAKSTTAPKPATAVSRNPADNPPGVPPVAGTPRVLYALRYVDTKVGDGPLAVPQKYMTVRYTGWLTNGTKFDSSFDHPGQQPITFFLGGHRVIPGWDTGFEGMRVGGKRRLYIPWQLAYGDQGRDPIPPKSDLIFDIELVQMGDSPNPAPPTPAPTQQPSTAPAGTPDAPTANPR